GGGTSGFILEGSPAASAQLERNLSVAVDAAGNLFITDTENNRIRKVTPAGIISLVAGIVNYGGFSGDGGLAVSAQLNYPEDAAVDAAGNLFIADTDNNRIRKVTSAGLIATFAGTGTGGSFVGSGTSPSALLR